MNRFRVLGVLVLTSAAACGGLKEAFSAHADTVARAAGQELTVQQLAELMANSKVPIRKEVAQSIADAWINYHLIAEAGAKGDSLSDPKLIDDAMWSVYTTQKTNKFYKQVSEKWTADTSDASARAAFDKGDLLAARHILFMVPQGAQTGGDSIMKKAEGVLARTTAANFASLAKQYGSDGTKDTGGDLGVFPPTAMVPEFANAVKALKPGEIGPLVKTQFGYHIVRRSTYDEAKEQFKPQFLQRQKFVNESTYITGLETAGKLEFKPELAKTVKAIAVDPSAHVDDKTVVATSRLGNFTAADVTRWLQSFPNPDQLRGQIGQAPDSLMKTFVNNLLRNELILDEATKAKVELDSTEVKDIRNSFRAVLTNAWTGLKVSPALLGDSAKTEAERSRVAAARIDAYLKRLIAGEEQFVEVPAPIANALHKKYDAKLNAEALDKVVAAATPLRAKADSSRASDAPKSAVPMPGATPPAAPPADSAKKP